LEAVRILELGEGLRRWREREREREE